MNAICLQIFNKNKKTHKKRVKNRYLKLEYLYENKPLFSLKLEYEGNKLINCYLDGKEY